MQSTDDLRTPKIAKTMDVLDPQIKRVRQAIESEIYDVVKRFDTVYHPTAITILARLLRNLWTKMASIEVSDLAVPMHTSITVDYALWDSYEVKHELREMVRELFPGWSTSQIGQPFDDPEDYSILVCRVTFVPHTGT